MPLVDRASKSRDLDGSSETEMEQLLFVQGSKTQSLIRSPLMVEALALLAALHKALDLGFEKLLMVSDSQQLITYGNQLQDSGKRNLWHCI